MNQRALFVTWTLCLIVVLSSEAAAAAEEPVSEDTCLLELSLPAGASFRINDEKYPASARDGEQRLVPFRPFRSGQVVEYKLNVTFRDDQTAQRTLLLRGGERVKLSMLSPAKKRPEVVLQLGHAAWVVSVAFSPDGRRALTGSNTAILWDAETGRELRKFEVGAASVAFSPDGRRVLTGSADETAKLWDTETGREIRTFQGHPDTIRSVAFSPAGDRLLTAGGTKAKLWDTETGRELRTFEGHPYSINSVAFGAGGRVLTNLRTTAILWDADTGRELRTFQGHTDSVESVAMSADGRRILTGSKDKTAKLWDAETGRELRTFRLYQPVGSVSISADGQRVLLSGSRDKRSRLWDAETGRVLRSFEGHTKWVQSVSISLDGRRVLTGSADKTAKLWDAETGRELLALKPAASPIASALFGPDGRRVLVTDDENVKLWDASVPSQLRTFHGHTAGISCVAFSADGHRVLTGSYDKTAKLWDAGTGRELRTFQEKATVTLVVISADGRRALIGSYDNPAKLWDTETGRELPEFQRSHHTWRRFSPDGRYVLTASYDKTAKLWDAKTGSELRTFQGHSDVVNSISFSADGRRVLTGSKDHTWKLWDAETGRKVQTSPGNSSNVVDLVTLSPDGRLALSRSWDKKVVLWDAETGRELRMFQGRTDLIRSVVFSPDSHLALTIDSFSTTATLWDVATGRELRTFIGHVEEITSASFSPDSKTLLTASKDGTARLWSIATGEELARLINIAGPDSWLVVSAEGLFDGSPAGRESVAFRIGEGLTVVPVDRFFNDFYTPGLLGQILGGESPMPDVELGRELPPKIRIVSPGRQRVSTESIVRLEVAAEDQGGGIRGPWLKHNGARVLGTVESRREGKTLHRTFDVRLVAGENRLEVGASTNNEFATIDSDPAVLVLRYEKPLEKPRLYLVTSGCNNYADASLRLRFARQDAESLGAVFKQRGDALYEKVYVVPLLDENVTKAKLRETIDKIAGHARPQDTLMVFLAGHGTTVGQRYFYIPHSFQRQADTLEKDIKSQAIAADVLGDWMATVPCLKRMLILDTCSSGGAVQLASASRNPFALRGVIERLNRNEGVFTIAAAASTEEAQEVEELGHGVLTYALLAGLGAVDSGPLEDSVMQTNSPDRVATVMEWFGYADSRVPRLMKKYFGQAQDIQFGGQGTSFPVLPLDD